MTRRYFFQNSNEQNVRLSDAEAHHFIHVMRGKIGQELELFDGSGNVYRAKVSQISRKEIDLEILETNSVDRELAQSLTVAVAMPKGDRQKFLVEKLVELGVSELVPIHCERTVSRINSQSINRIQRSVIEASKQCGRNKLMQISAEVGFHEFAKTQSADSLKLIAHPGKNDSVNMGEIIAECSNRDVQILVGPEGGFTDAEVEFAVEKGWQIVDLGSRILRTETAAISLAAICSLHWASSHKVHIRETISEDLIDD